MGTARDLEVMKEQLVSLLDAEPPDREVALARDWLEEQLDAEHATALASGLSALSSDRYFRLLDALDDFLASPPLTSQAQKAAERTVGRLVNGERKRLKGAVKKFAGLTTEQAANLALRWK
ncbi:CHAD domain-containing protein [Leucobacter sp. W1038]|uniref:CHAD domain-containing protein n=1 Tax=Leucobacter sp. W1038 TaxID=3438281 RepID=UPI003D96EC8B